MKYFNKTIYLLTVCICFCAMSSHAQHSMPLQAADLQCEYGTNPLAIDATTPRLSWKLKTDTHARNVLQIAYEIRVNSDKNNTWTSGRINSAQSTDVPYSGPALASRQYCTWQVRVWDNNGHVSPWSNTSTWKMGLLHPTDWTAHWIQHTLDGDTTGGPSPLFRKSFPITHAVKSAYLYITAHGIYEAQLNGQRVGSDHFAPGWTSYNKRLQYQVYDVTRQLKQGDNAMGVMLGDGWYRGYTYDFRKNIYGRKLALLAQLEITYTDGSTAVIQTDGSWKAAYGPIHYNSFFNGETYDARQEKNGWSSANYRDEDWAPVQVNDTLHNNLVAMQAPPVTQHESFKPARILTTPAGERVIDFGQNLTGWVQIRVKGKAGDTLKLYHAEVLDQQGNFYTANLRSAKQEIHYIFKDNTVINYTPHFTFQGFRYIKITGYDGPIDSSTFVAHALYSDMTTTGHFNTSNALVNQLQHNIAWGQKGNFLDVPTDCPQRDERMGWTGDAQTFSRTATFNMDVAGFFGKWLKDLAADQRADGAIPYVIPNVLDTSLAAATGWSDAATIVPWNMYQAYGDKQILAQQYESMKAWVGYIQRHSEDDLWNTGSHFGDWLSYSGGEHGPGAASTDNDLIAQAFYAYSTQLLVKTATLLGKTADANVYDSLLTQVKKAFLREYVTPGGRMISATQTAYVLALQFDLLPEDMRQAAVERLVDNIHAYDDHMTTGFLGTPYLCHVLSRFGYTDLAYTLLTQKTYPSWLYPVTRGATTIWERQDAIRPDGSFQDAGMNSFNHYSYGSIGDWMYRVVAGINTAEDDPGFHKIIIAPQPGHQLDSAQATLETRYGTIRSAWHNTPQRFILDVTIPPNTTAVIVLPHAPALVTESGKDIHAVKEISHIMATGAGLQLTTGSGNYHFEYTRTGDNATAYTQYVDPFIGTSANGHTFPGAALPFGLVQLSPETGNFGWNYCSGYRYEDSTISGFAHTHLSGTGGVDLGDLLFFPFQGATPATFSSGFSKATESASPGYYTVMLRNNNIKAELTASAHTGVHRYTFLNGGDARLLVDLQSGLVDAPEQLNTHVNEGSIHIVDDHTISGYAETSGWVDRNVYFVAQFSQPFKDHHFIDSSLQRRLVLDFNSAAGAQLEARVGISAVSVEGAMANLSETKQKSFDEVKRAATQTWETYLSKVQAAGTPAQKTTFYTALYHTLLQPNNVADVDGRYRGADGNIHTASDGVYYSTLSLWDTYRAAHPLYTLLVPDKVEQMVNTMLLHFDAAHTLPVWTLWGKESFAMIGNHSIPVIVDAVLKGIPGIDAEKAFRAVKYTLTHAGNEKYDWSLYMRYGYLPSDTVHREAVSRTLEAAYDDWCAAQLAAYLHKKEDAQYFTRRAQFYHHLFDHSTNLMRGRLTNGNWVTPFANLDSGQLATGGDYTEGNAWQYVWQVQQDIPGLIKLMGGNAAFIAKLDSLFTLEPKVFGRGSTLDVTGLIGQYAHGNEPVHHVAYLYAMAGAPEKTQAAVNKIATLFYKNTPEGLCGNDDCGQMSAWYVFAAMGFYPVNPADGRYVLSAPLLKQVTLQLPGGKQFMIENRSAGSAAQHVLLNNKPYPLSYITHQEIMQGGTLVFY